MTNTLPINLIQPNSIWCQWCLGHLSTPDLLLFLARSKKALRQNTTPDSPAYIFVKENVCDNAPDGKGTEFLDEEDSSLTRSVHFRTSRSL